MESIKWEYYYVPYRMLWTDVPSEYEILRRISKCHEEEEDSEVVYLEVDFSSQGDDVLEVTELVEEA